MMPADDMPPFDAPLGDDDAPLPAGPPPWLQVIEGGDEPTARPTIRQTPDLDVVVSAAIAALAAHPDVYQRGGVLVHVTPAPDKPAGSVRRAPGAPTIAPLPKARLREMLASTARYMKFDKRSESWVHALPIDPVTDAVQARGAWPGVRPLEAVVECPVLLPDGEILTRPGYDRASGLLLAPNVAIPDMPDRPTRADALRAVATILDLVEDRPGSAGFPFGDPRLHFAVFLAAILTPLARHAFAGFCPITIFDSNLAGTGKSMLADLVSAIVEGRTMARSGFTSDDEEMRKAITSHVIAGDRLVLFDNLDGVFGGAALDRALTADVWSDRVLGSNSNITLPIQTVWFATGVNVAIGADVASRAIHCRIVSPSENPTTRTGFRYPDPVKHALEHRTEYLGAALTILRAFHLAGRPPTPGTRVFSRMTAWADLVRNALAWAGCDDPVRTQIDLAARDERGNVAAELIEGVADLCRDLQASELGAQDVRDALKEAMEPSVLPKHQTLLGAVQGLLRLKAGVVPSTQGIGKCLRAHAERVAGGLMLTAKYDTDAKAWRYGVRKVPTC